MKKLFIMCALVVLFFGVSLNHVTYVNSFEGETVVGILGGAVAGCALNEAYNDVKDNSNRTQATRDDLRPRDTGDDRFLFERCNDRFPDDDEMFFKCWKE